MRIYVIAEMGGEGAIRAFSALSKANAAAKATDGMVLEAPPVDDSFHSTEIPSCSEVAGNPSKVFLVCCGDSGCTCGFLKAFLDQASGDAAAAAAGQADKMGLSYYVVGADVEK